MDFKTYSTKDNLKFISKTNEEKRLSLAITITSTDQLNNKLLDPIKRLIDKLVLDDYMTLEEYKQMKKQEKELLKEEKEMKKKDTKARRPAKEVYY